MARNTTLKALERDKGYEEGFEHGVLWAVARIVELHDQPTIAADVLHESGYELNLRKADEADRPFLKPLKDEVHFRKVKP